MKSSLTFVFALLLTSGLQAQQGQQPPPFTAPNPATAAATQSPGQQTPPSQQTPVATPDAPLPQPNQSTIDLRDVKPLSPQAPAPTLPSQTIQQTQSSNATPRAEAPSKPDTHIYNTIDPYRAPHIPQLAASSSDLLPTLIRDGKLYLSLHDAILLALEDNLDVEVSRYNLLLANTDFMRAKGGGTLRGLDYTVAQTPLGVGSATSPLLITATTGNSSSPTNVSVTDLSQVTQTGSGTSQSLSENSSNTFSTGPAVPLFDPSLIGDAGYLRRSDQTSLESTATPTATATATTTTTTAASTAPLAYVSAGLDYQQGFSTGAQIDAYVDNAAQVLYAGNSQYNPFHAPSSSFTITQPLLRERGRDINLRFIRIAQINQKVSRLLFEQQVLETIYGVSRLYYDLVSLGENIGVKQQALAAADQLFKDDKNQVDEGTLAPIELTRAQALLSSSRLDLIQAQGEYRQQEVILREQLVRKLDDPVARFASIVPTDSITVPADAPVLDVSALTQDALSNRPDLAQASLQIKTDEIASNASHNNLKPLLNLYANVQTRGASLTPLNTLGSPGTDVAIAPPALTQGGLRLSTIYQAGVQLNMPLHNRIAQADYARDAIQLRQAQGRTLKLENDIRQQVENASIALDTAHQAYGAAVESRNFQQQLLQAEKDKFAVGASTNFFIIQDQAYLAQALSTEVAARSDWMKARIALDRALGDLLEKNNITLDDSLSR